ncbi:hypothetical protein MTO96_028000 [Rhipicephalus appendiculatus]
MRTAPVWLLVAILVIGSWALQYFDISANAFEHPVDEDEPSFEGSAEKESPADIYQEEYLPYDQHEDKSDYPEDADEEYPPGLIDEAEEHDYFLDASPASPYSPPREVTADPEPAVWPSATVSRSCRAGGLLCARVSTGNQQAATRLVALSGTRRIASCKPTPSPEDRPVPQKRDLAKIQVLNRESHRVEALVEMAGLEECSGEENDMAEFVP